MTGFHEREADVVLLSLVRSGDQRPLPYAEHEHEWRTALTRARSQLLVFGDTGALERRSQFQGPLGRQTDTLASLERTIAVRLLPRSF